MFETDLYSHLSTYAGLMSLVGTKVYPVIAPQNVEGAFCVFTKISRNRLYSHGGFSNLEKIRGQVSCYADNPLEAKEIAEQVILAVEAWPTAQARVQAAFIENEADVYNDPTGLFFIPVDFVVNYG